MRYCYTKRLICKQFVQVSDLCGPQFLSYLPKRFKPFVELFMETPYWCTILVHQYGRWKSTKTSGVHFSKKIFLFTRELAYVHINISSNTEMAIYCWNSRGETFFQRDSIPFFCHALWKLGSSNCCIFEMKHATGMETCAKIYFFVYLQPTVNKNSSLFSFYNLMTSLWNPSTLPITIMEGNSHARRTYGNSSLSINTQIWSAAVFVFRQLFCSSKLTFFFSLWMVMKMTYTKCKYIFMKCYLLIMFASIDDPEK